ncbi:hypothetical protein CBR_g28825 [Chara braunii]|uniref:Ferrochelatase n=1 Tax=Chara braunii TaxID=69332 RepID=A0A388L9W9_CHABU|nr:hypothetical protein CBR_g28825 [Chara braunii]|eukprot:GBG79110.1 hypothetical protein CBR_g28825 [Chara braunii]
MMGRVLSFPGCVHGGKPLGEVLPVITGKNCAARSGGGEFSVKPRALTWPGCTRPRSGIIHVLRREDGPACRSRLWLQQRTIDRRALLSAFSCAPSLHSSSSSCSACSALQASICCPSSLGNLSSSGLASSSSGGNTLRRRSIWSLNDQEGFMKCVSMRPGGSHLHRSKWGTKCRKKDGRGAAPTLSVGGGKSRKWMVDVRHFSTSQPPPPPPPPRRLLPRGGLFPLHASVGLIGDVGGGYVSQCRTKLWGERRVRGGEEEQMMRVVEEERGRRWATSSSLGRRWRVGKRIGKVGGEQGRGGWAMAATAVGGGRSSGGRWNLKAFALSPTAESDPLSSQQLPDGGNNRSSVAADTENIGVLLLNLGGPETLDDVQPFLYNLFADPDIIRLPRLLRFLQKPLAGLISSFRAPKSTEAYRSIGGGSPLRKITIEQAEALREALWSKNVPAQTYVGMRYWHPFTEEAIERIKQDKITRLVVLPLYPQFSISTSGSSLRLLEELFREDEFLVKIKHTVIPSWYQRTGYVESMANLIEEELGKFADPTDVTIFFSAHGVPKAYVLEAGDPYEAEMEECVELITLELGRRGIRNPHVLAYQSRVGPVEWLKPYTDDTIRELGERGVRSLLAVPISFVSEHIETLEEIDMEYRELAIESGIRNWGRVPALGCYPTFIEDLADAVLEALPYVGAMAASNLEARQALVPLGSVEELLATYDTQRREIPPPIPIWEWGWTKSAETWNGRLAMLAVMGLLLMEVSTGRGILHWWGILPLLK